MFLYWTFIYTGNYIFLNILSQLLVVRLNVWKTGTLSRISFCGTFVYHRVLSFQYIRSWDVGRILFSEGRRALSCVTAKEPRGGEGKLGCLAQILFSELPNSSHYFTQYRVDIISLRVLEWILWENKQKRVSELWRHTRECNRAPEREITLSKPPKHGFIILSVYFIMLQPEK